MTVKGWLPQFSAALLELPFLLRKHDEGKGRRAREDLDLCLCMCILKVSLSAWFQKRTKTLTTHFGVAVAGELSFSEPPPPPRIAHSRLPVLPLTPLNTCPGLSTGREFADVDPVTCGRFMFRATQPQSCPSNLKRKPHFLQSLGWIHLRSGPVVRGLLQEVLWVECARKVSI